VSSRPERLDYVDSCNAGLQMHFEKNPVLIESAIYAENNFFWVNPSAGITPDMFIERLNGTAIYESGTMLNSPSQSGWHTVDVLAEYNAVNDPDLLSDVGWTPTLFIDFLETQDVIPAVESGAGPFNW